MMDRERGAPFLAACAALFMVLLTTGGGVQGRTVDGDRRRGRSLFVFGDSYADTGNLAKIIGPAWNEPYGLTFPRKPAGRFSDGRVFTDYLASVFGIRSPLPYKYRKYGKKLLPYGMNFAVGGSGVFDGLFFQDNLTVQIDHFQAQVEEGVFPNLDLARSTAVVCISGNDYMFYEEAGGTLEGMRKEFIPKLIEQLKSDLKRLRQLGVGKVAATSLHPIGCVPRMSSSFAYRSCNQTVNLAVMYHNGLLADAVSELINGAAAGGGDDQNSSTSTTAAAAAPFVIVDLYDAFTTVLNKAPALSPSAPAWFPPLVAQPAPLLQTQQGAVTPHAPALATTSAPAIQVAVAPTDAQARQVDVAHAETRHGAVTPPGSAGNVVLEPALVPNTPLMKLKNAEDQQAPTSAHTKVSLFHLVKNMQKHLINNTSLPTATNESQLQGNTTPSSKKSDIMVDIDNIIQRTVEANLAFNGPPAQKEDQARQMKISKICSRSGKDALQIPQSTAGGVGNDVSSSSGTRKMISRPRHKGGVRICLPYPRAQSPSPPPPTIPYQTSLNMEVGRSVTEQARADNILMPGSTLSDEESDDHDEEDDADDYVNERCRRRPGLRPRGALRHSHSWDDFSLEF